MNTNTARTPANEPPNNDVLVTAEKWLVAAESRRSVKPIMREDAIAARLDAMREAGIRDRTIAIEAKLKLNELKEWINGLRKAEVTKALSVWLTDIDDEIAALEGDFIMIPTAARIVKAIEQARTPRGNDKRRGVALIYGASGAGKSETVKWLARMDDNVCYVQVDGERRKYVPLLKAVVEATTGYGGHANVGEKMRDYITRNLPQGSVLIFDHAQLIPLSIMEQLLIFPDEYGIALAFVGNTRGYSALINAKLAQITSRVAGAHIVVEIPGEEDIDSLLEAWGVAGRPERKFCMMIGRQDGGLRFLSETVREARKLVRAAGAQKLDERFLKLGAVNAGCWGGAE
ncbi:MAG: AAA family ATPase [Gallionella sp.]